jgi:hypothetical protein
MNMVDSSFLSHISFSILKDFIPNLEILIIKLLLRIFFRYILYLVINFNTTALQL